MKFPLTTNDGITFLWLIIAHILTDFVLQRTKWVEAKYRKKHKSPFLYIHALIAGITTYIASLMFNPIWWPPLLIAITHGVIDWIKVRFDNEKSLTSFLLDQLAHLTVIILAWIGYTKKIDALSETVSFFLHDYKTLLILTAYIWVIWPVSIIIKLAVKNLLPPIIPPIRQNLGPAHDDDPEIEQAGKFIGIFERTIILTLVILGEYEAIGFLITGKSIIRLGKRNQTEYVLAGTLISYAVAITTGVLLNWLLLNIK